MAQNKSNLKARFEDKVCYDKNAYSYHILHLVKNLKDLRLDFIEYFVTFFSLSLNCQSNYRRCAWSSNHKPLISKNCCRIWYYFNYILRFFQYFTSCFTVDKHLKFRYFILSIQNIWFFEQKTTFCTKVL